LSSKSSFSAGLTLNSAYLGNIVFKTMLFEEIIPHLNKMASVVLMNNKRKVGFLFLDLQTLEENKYSEVVYFLTVMKSRQLLRAEPDIEKIKEQREEIPLSQIRKIKSV
jgi:hypothetical protein